MPKLSFSVEIQKPVEHCWSIFTDKNLLPEWLLSFKSIELLEGQENEVGSSYRVLFENGGKEMEMKETITAFEQNQLFSNTSTSDMLDTTMAVKFIPIAAGTRLDIEATFEGKNMMGNLFLRMALGMIEKNLKLSYQNLKELAERS